MEFLKAPYILGLAYGHGRDVQKDFTEATKWMHKAAEQGHIGIQETLGPSYCLGQGVLKDIKRSITFIFRMLASVR